ncbi:hypothetical protein KY338_02010 [Candidatus Woesearchaeota archaeon]|nr:hypothetical protein [Candidatus Woesearchaeota archaeon]MBW3005948.1 hypothetical protein [Candidatus Woesearchaeota archaeon]
MKEFSEVSHKKGLERLVEGLTGRKPEFIYARPDEKIDRFAHVVNKGEIPVIIPSELIAYYEKYKENADYLEFLVAIQAGRLLYGSAAVSLDDFIEYQERLYKDGFIKKEQPIWHIDDFFSTFEERDYLAKQIFEIVESARVNACLRRDYLGFKQILEDVIPAKFKELLDGLGKLPKQMLDNTVLTLLQYKLLLGYLPEHEIKPKQGEHNRIRAAKKKGIIIKPFVQQCYDLLDECYDLASVVLERGSDLGDSFIVTKKLHRIIYEHTKEVQQQSYRAPQKKVKGLRGFLNKETMIVTDDVSKLEIFKDNKIKHSALAKETPQYLEWDSVNNKYIEGFPVFEKQVRLGKTHRIIVPNQTLVQKLKREFSLMKPGGRTVLKKQRSGELDYERFVEYQNDIAAGVTPDERIFQKVLNRRRDVAAALVVDLSGSTNRWINEETRLIDVIAEAVYYLGCGASQLDDLVGVFGYSSYSRRRTDFYIIADFGKAHPDNLFFLDELSRITGKKHNHDGTAIRHTTKKLLETGRKDLLLIHISDGEPETVPLQKDLYRDEKNLPVYKGEYAWNDVRKALSEARARGVLPVCIRVNDQRADNLERAYGVHYKVLPNPFDLQKVLCTTYKDLVS